MFGKKSGGLKISFIRLPGPSHLLYNGWVYNYIQHNPKIVELSCKIDAIENDFSFYVQL